MQELKKIEMIVNDYGTISFRVFNSNGECANGETSWLQETQAYEMPTIEKALEIIGDLNNGAIQGWDSSKGGRAWMEGEFQLCELEALCVVIRHQSGKHAEGASELVAVQKGI